MVSAKEGEPCFNAEIFAATGLNSADAVCVACWLPSESDNSASLDTVDTEPLEDPDLLWVADAEGEGE